MSISSSNRCENVPLLPRGQGTELDLASPQESLAHHLSELRNLEELSASRRTRIKAAACCLWLPVNIPCTIVGLFCCGGMSAFSDRQDERGVLYCDRSTCESDGDRPCFRAALPPETSCDLCKLTLDPCVPCSYCCGKESVETYLLGPERQEMKTHRAATQQLAAGATRSHLVKTLAKNPNSKVDVNFLVARNELLTPWITVQGVRDIVLDYLTADAVIGTDDRREKSKVYHPPALDRSQRFERQFGP